MGGGVRGRPGAAAVAAGGQGVECGAAAALGPPPSAAGGGWPAGDMMRVASVSRSCHGTRGFSKLTGRRLFSEVEGKQSPIN